VNIIIREIILLGYFCNPDNALTLAIRQQIIQQEKREIKYYVLICIIIWWKNKHFLSYKYVVGIFLYFKIFKSFYNWLIRDPRGRGETVSLSTILHHWLRVLKFYHIQCIVALNSPSIRIMFYVHIIYHDRSLMLKGHRVTFSQVYCKTNMYTYIYLRITYILWIEFTCADLCCWTRRSSWIFMRSLDLALFPR